MYSGETGLRDIQNTAVGCDFLTHMVANGLCTDTELDGLVKNNVPLLAANESLGGPLDDRAVESLVRLLNQNPASALSPKEQPKEVTPAWWKETVIYQIYPRSFADSNGDGIGDIRGIINHLDDLADLGVGALWLSPIFDSPNNDFGYDIRDYQKIMDEMGTMQDVDRLVDEAHQRSIRIILDLVVNHTSDQHKWAQSALADPTGEAGKRYILVPGTPDNPPNNWTSFFGGSAWRWYADAGVWALHLFDPTQLDLNWDNPTVRWDVAQMVKWWVDKGIDGFRMDVINLISKEPGMPDGSKTYQRMYGPMGIENYSNGPRLHDYLRELRQNGFRKEDGDTAVMIGETNSLGSEVGKLLSQEGNDELDMVFVFDHIMPAGKTKWDSYRYDLNYLKQCWMDLSNGGGALDWPAVVLENHDNPRMISKIQRHATDRQRTTIGQLLATWQLTTRGTPFIYQGQEIGAINQNFTSSSDLRDVESINMFHELQEKGYTAQEAWAVVLNGARDHARTPMRWSATDNCGFSTGTPWMGFFEDSVGWTWDEQKADPDSVWNRYRDVIALRRQDVALVYGDVTFIEPDLHNYCAYIRSSKRSAYLVELNLADTRQPRPAGWDAMRLGREAGKYAGCKLHQMIGKPVDRTHMMMPYESTIWRLTRDEISPAV